jgi:thioredoxin reductase
MSTATELGSPATESYDCIVVGGGVAGLSAAMVLGRARRRTLLLDAGGQSNQSAPHVGGLLGHDGTPPAQFYELARRQVTAYEAVTFNGVLAAGARAAGADFVLTLADGGGEVRSRSLIIATGMTYEIPDVPGFAELWGDAVFHCSFCHGWDVRDQTVAVYGTADIATRLARLLAAWTDDVITVDPTEVTGVRVEDGALRGLVRRDGADIECTAVLIHAPLCQRGQMASDLGLELTESGFIAVDDEMHTSVPGVYAAGDVAVAPQQVAVAMGSGHTAGLVAVRELMLGRPT